LSSFFQFLSVVKSRRISPLFMSFLLYFIVYVCHMVLSVFVCDKVFGVLHEYTHELCNKASIRGV
jgi:hypothetical protein